MPLFRDRVWDDQVEKSCIVADQRLVTGLSTDVYRLVDRDLRGLLSLAHPLARGVASLVLSDLLLSVRDLWE